MKAILQYRPQEIIDEIAVKYAVKFFADSFFELSKEDQKRLKISYKNKLNSLLVYLGVMDREKANMLADLELLIQDE